MLGDIVSQSRYLSQAAGWFYAYSGNTTMLPQAFFLGLYGIHNLARNFILFRLNPTINNKTLFVC